MGSNGPPLSSGQPSPPGPGEEDAQASGGSENTAEGTRSYQDPVLNSKKVLLELLLRLHLGGMIATTNREEATVSFFAVVKKLQEVGVLDRYSHRSLR